MLIGPFNSFVKLIFSSEISILAVILENKSIRISTMLLLVITIIKILFLSSRVVSLGFILLSEGEALPVFQSSLFSVVSSN